MSGRAEDGIDVGRDRRAEADVEPAGLAEVQPVLRGVEHDPAAELEPRSGQARSTITRPACPVAQTAAPILSMRLLRRLL